MDAVGSEAVWTPWGVGGVWTPWGVAGCGRRGELGVVDTMGSEARLIHTADEWRPPKTPAADCGQTEGGPSTQQDVIQPHRGGGPDGSYRRVSLEDTMPSELSRHTRTKTW